MGYQDIPSSGTPGAGAGSGEVVVSAADTTGGFLNVKLTTTTADITKAITSPGANEKLNLSLPNVGPGAVTSGSATAPIQSAVTDHAGRVTSFTLAKGNETVANWTGERFFLWDYDGGDDANVGYVDSTAGATIAPAGLAKKTWDGTTGMSTIIPRHGNGRDAVLLIKPRAAGATYLNVDAVTATDLDLSTLVGYHRWSTRGSTDLTNSATDRLLCGGVVGYAGPNGDSSWTTAAGATTAQLTVNAGTLPAEGGSAAALTAYIGGMRIRFTGDVTGALANVSRMVYRNGAGTSTIEFGQNLSGAPALNDTFFLERPGVRFNTFQDHNSYNPIAGGTGSDTQTAAGGFTVGIATVSTGTSFRFGASDQTRQTYAFCESNGAACNDRMGAHIQWSPSYTDEAGTARDVGAGVRSRGFFFGTGSLSEFTVAARGMHFTAGAILRNGAQTLAIGGGNYVGDGLVLLQVPSLNPIIGNFGSASIAKLRIVRATNLHGTGACGMLVDGGHMILNGIEWQDCSTGPCLLVGLADRPTMISVANCVSAAAGGNTQYGMTISAGPPRGSLISVATTTTVTGTLGDIRFATDSVTAAWADLTLTNVPDRLGNNVVGTAGHVVSGPPYLVSNQTGGAVAVGEIVRKNATSNQVLSAQADTSANAPFAGVMITSAASASAGYMVTRGTPYVLFDGTPTIGAIAYLSPGTIRKATTTIPAVSGTNQKLRLGRAFSASGSTGLLVLRPENLSGDADGLA